MKLTNCERCGNVFNSEREETVCQNCLMEENKDLKKITDYLREHPLASIMEVHEKTKVDQPMIFRFVKAGSLKISQAKDMNKCRICGKASKTGAVCESCASKIRGIDPKKPK